MSDELRAEAWAIEQLRLGKPVQFSAEWTDDERSVTGGFVLRYLIDRCVVDGAGAVIISNAIVTSDVIQTYALVEREFMFTGCIFKGEVFLPFCEFKRGIHFYGCTFEKKCYLRRCSAPDLDFGFLDDTPMTTFMNEADFNGAKVSGFALFRKAVFGGLANFAGSDVGGELQLSEARFNGPVVFVGARINRILCFNAGFLDEKSEADFSAISVSEQACFEGSVFHGSVDFTGAEIAGQLRCDRVEWKSEKGSVRFNSARIKRTAFLREAVFSGPVEFARSEIGGDLNCASADFNNELASASFNGIAVGGQLILQKATFLCSADFTGARIAGQLICADAEFKNSKTDFNGLRLAGHAIFLRAGFIGAASFFGAEIGGHFVFQHAVALGSKQVIEFNRMVIAGDGLFQRAKFWSSADFGGAFIKGHLMLQGATFKAAVDLNHCEMSQTVSLVGAQFEESLNFSNTCIRGALYVFEDHGPGKDVSNRQTALPGAGDLRRLTFDRSDLAENDRWKTWIALACSADGFAPDPYLVLERSFRKDGLEALADRIHYSMRRKEGQALWRESRFDKWALNSLLRLSVGYGVYGWRLFIWAWVVLVPAWIFFYPTMETTNPVWSLLYTLDLFLPVDLKQIESYRKQGPWISVVTFIVTLWGWFIVPLALAQLAGLLKKRG